MTKIVRNISPSQRLHLLWVNAVVPQLTTSSLILAKPVPVIFRGYYSICNSINAEIVAGGNGRCGSLPHLPVASCGPADFLQISKKGGTLIQCSARLAPTTQFIACLLDKRGVGDN